MVAAMLISTSTAAISDHIGPFACFRLRRSLDAVYSGRVCRIPHFPGACPVLDMLGFTYQVRSG